MWINSTETWTPSPAFTQLNLYHNEIVTDTVVQAEQPKYFPALLSFQIFATSLPQIHKLQAKNIINHSLATPKMQFLTSALPTVDVKQLLLPKKSRNAKQLRGQRLL